MRSISRSVWRGGHRGESSGPAGRCPHTIPAGGRVAPAPACDGVAGRAFPMARVHRVTRPAGRRRGSHAMERLPRRLVTITLALLCLIAGWPGPPGPRTPARETTWACWAHWGYGSCWAVAVAGQPRAGGQRRRARGLPSRHRRRLWRCWAGSPCRRPSRASPWSATLAYVASRDAGLRIVDLARPVPAGGGGRGRGAGRRPRRGGRRRLRLRGGRGAPALRVIDVSDPTAPVAAGAWTPTASP